MQTTREFLQSSRQCHTKLRRISGLYPLPYITMSERWGNFWLLSILVRGRNIRETVAASAKRSRNIEDKGKRVIGWYSVVDPCSNHLAACEKREPTTGAWFLGCEE